MALGGPGWSTLPAGEDPPSWPQFRGPRRDGVSTETGLLAGWSEAGPRVLWRHGLGGGFSGISYADGRLYTMFSEGSDEFLVSLDAASGKEVWRRRVGTTFKDRFGDGPRSTPTVVDGVAYTLGSKGQLAAWKAGDGAAVWSHDLVREYGAGVPTWGVASSPLVEGQLLLVDVGGKKDSSIVAFDKTSGKEVWRAQDDKAGYSAPLAITVGGLRQVLFLTGTRLVALAPEDGRRLWTVPWKTSYDVNASTPVFVPPDGVFVSTGYDVGAVLFKVRVSDGRARVERVWQSREMRNKFSSSVLHEGHLYGFDEGTLKCIEAATGEPNWRTRGLGHGSLIIADGHLIALGDKGILVQAEATPEAYRETGRVRAFEGKTWTVPTLAGGRLYLRDENELISMDLRAGVAKVPEENQ